MSVSDFLYTVLLKPATDIRCLWEIKQYYNELTKRESGEKQYVTFYTTGRMKILTLPCIHFKKETKSIVIICQKFEERHQRRVAISYERVICKGKEFSLTNITTAATGGALLMGYYYGWIHDTCRTGQYQMC